MKDNNFETEYVNKTETIEKLFNWIFYRQIKVTLGGMLEWWYGFCFTKYCQAQSQLQVKLSLKTELALVSANPANHPPHPRKMQLHLREAFTRKKRK